MVVAICAGAVRRWLIEHDELPDDAARGADPGVGAHRRAGRHLRQPDHADGAPLFTNGEDPVERLRQTHEALSRMKERHRALPAELLQDANHFIPPAVFARAARLTFGFSTSGPGGRPGTS